MTGEEKRLYYKIIKEKNRVKKLNGLVALYENNKDNHLIVFHLLKTLGQFKEYRQRAKELLLLMLDYYHPCEIYFVLGKLELLDKNLSDAKKYFEQIPESDRLYPNAGLEISLIYFKENDLNNAKQKLLEIESKTPGDKAVYSELGQIAEFESNNELALSYYEKYLEIKEDDEILLKIAEIHKKLGNNSKVREYILRAYEMNPNNKKILSEMGQQEFLSGNYDAARNYYQKGLEKDPNYIPLHVGLGLLEEVLNNDVEAEKHYKLGLTIKNDRKSNYRLALFYKKHNKIEEAISQFKNIDNYENIISVLFELVNLELKQDNIEEALYYFIKILNMDDLEKIDERNLKRTETYLKYKLGILKEEKFEEETFYHRQLINYEENKVVKRLESNFSEDFDVEKMLPFIKNKINEEHFSNTIAVTDFYVIDCGFPVGTAKGIETNLIRVLTILNTDKILKIEPYIPSRITWSKEDNNQKTRIL